MNENIRLDKLKKIIGELNMNQVELSKKLDMNRTYINRVFNGNVVLSDKFINKICNTFSIGINYFDDTTPVDDLVFFSTQTKKNNDKIKSPLIQSIHRQIDDLIDYKGTTNIEFQRTLSKLFNLLNDYLMCLDDCDERELALEKYEYMRIEINEIIDEL